MPPGELKGIINRDASRAVCKSLILCWLYIEIGQRSATKVTVSMATGWSRTAGYEQERRCDTGQAMSDTSPGERHYSTLVVQPWGEPGNYWQATIVRVCRTVAEAFRYIDFVELTLARPAETLQ